VNKINNEFNYNPSTNNFTDIEYYDQNTFKHKSRLTNGNIYLFYDRKRIKLIGNICIYL